MTFSGVIRLDGDQGQKGGHGADPAPGETGRSCIRSLPCVSRRMISTRRRSASVPRESVLKVDRKFSGSRRAIIHQRRSLVDSTNGELKLRVILDRFSVEVFVNDGEQVMTATMYTDQSADGISFFADGTVNMDVVKYDLVSEG